MQLWGHCADFCSGTDDVRTDGLTVTEHDPWCRSQATVHVDGCDAETGRRRSLSATIVRSYLHGIYHRTVVWRRPEDEQMQLSLMDGDDVVAVVNVDVGDALRLAAGLTRACAVADRLDEDYNGAKARRAADR